MWKQMAFCHLHEDVRTNVVAIHFESKPLMQNSELCLWRPWDGKIEIGRKLQLFNILSQIIG